MEACETRELLTAITGQGGRAELREGVLWVGPRSVMTNDPRAVVIQYRAELMAHLSSDDEDVRWRLANMLQQLLPLAWPCPVPLLVAVPDMESYGPADCDSCGELRDSVAGEGYLCGACARAKALALELWFSRPVQVLAA